MLLSRACSQVVFRLSCIVVIVSDKDFLAPFLIACNAHLATNMYKAPYMCRKANRMFSQVMLPTWPSLDV